MNRKSIFYVCLFGLVVVSCHNNKNKSVTLISHTKEELGNFEIEENDADTKFFLDLINLKPDEIYTVKIYSGSCDMLSASSTLLCTVITNEEGVAHASGKLRFRDTEQFKMSELTKEARTLLLESAHHQVCCEISFSV